MLSFPRIVRRSVQLATGILVADCVVGFLLTFLRFTFIEVVGDLILGEVAVLFITAGLIDFASSIGATQFRKTILASKQGYSSSKHKMSERQASVLFLAGVILFSILIVVSIYMHL
jgi:hypothetical protein